MTQSISLTTDPISQLTWRIALPMSVGMFFNTMFNVVDTLCAGWLGTDALAALSLSFPVFFMIIAVGSGLSQGTTALMANALGAGDTAEARRVFAQSLVFAVIAGIVLSIAGWLAAPSLFRLLGAEGGYLRTVLTFMNVTLVGGVFYLLPMVMNSALSAQGDTRVYRNFLIAGFAANIALNPVLMWGWFGLPAMGVGGIALATVLVQIGGAIYLGRSLLKMDLLRGLGRSDFRPAPDVLRRIAGQAVPAALNMLTVALGVFVITWFVKHFGKEAVAASGIATRIEQIVLMPAIGLNAAVLTIVGQNHGAGLTPRVREAWKTNVKFGAGLMLFGGLLVWLLREPACVFLRRTPPSSATDATTCSPHHSRSRRIRFCSSPSSPCRESSVPRTASGWASTASSPRRSSCITRSHSASAGDCGACGGASASSRGARRYSRSAGDGERSASLLDARKGGFIETPMFAVTSAADRYPFPSR